jgi:hypothetical protein
MANWIGMMIDMILNKNFLMIISCIQYEISIIFCEQYQFMGNIYQKHWVLKHQYVIVSLIYLNLISILFI